MMLPAIQHFKEKIPPRFPKPRTAPKYGAEFICDKITNINYQDTRFNNGDEQGQCKGHPPPHSTEPPQNILYSPTRHTTLHRPLPLSPPLTSNLEAHPTYNITTPASHMPLQGEHASAPPHNSAHFLLTQTPSHSDDAELWSGVSVPLTNGPHTKIIWVLMRIIEKGPYGAIAHVAVISIMYDVRIYFLFLIQEE
jgi:hypothetical protein